MKTAERSLLQLISWIYITWFHSTHATLSHGARFPGIVGDRMGAVRIGGSEETAFAEFWITAPIQSRAADAFAIVSASIYYRGRWGGAESSIAAYIFNEYCGAASGKAPLVLDIGSHIGYFTLLARAHGCDTHSVELNSDLLPYLKLSLSLNDFDPSKSALHHGFVGDAENTCAFFNDSNVSGEQAPKQIILDELLPPLSAAVPLLYVKLDVEGAEGAALDSPGSQRVLQTASYIYVELTLITCNRAMRECVPACGKYADASRALRALRSSGLSLYTLTNVTEGGGYAASGQLSELFFPEPDPSLSLSSEEAACIALLADGPCGGMTGSALYFCHTISATNACQVDVFGVRPPHVLPGHSRSPSKTEQSEQPNTDLGTFGKDVRAYTSAVDRGDVLAEVKTGLEWEWREPFIRQDTVTQDTYVSFGLVLHHSRKNIEIRYHVSVRASHRVLHRLPDDLCAYLEIDAVACKRMIGAVEKLIP